ncbi:MAG: c-type cytochrome, partial [Bryobacteraceae bacterium]
MRSSLILPLVFVPLLAQHENEGDAKKKKHPSIGNPVAIAAGKKLFAGSCGVCHGPAGQGGRGPNLRERNAWHPLDDDALFKTIRDGVPGSEMPKANVPEDQLWQLAAFVRALTAPAADTPVAGNAAAGEALFWGKANCGSCHLIRGRGGRLGPDLTDAGGTLPVEHMREAVLDPNANVNTGYRAVSVVRKDGRKVEGVARNFTNYSIQIQDSQGNLHLLSTADLREVRISKKSPMPADYGKRLTP